MPRNISTQLAAHLAEQVTTLSKLVLVTRRDGTKLGFTDHSADIAFGGVTYMAADGVALSALSQNIGTGVNNAEVIGILSDARITDADLAAGLYDGASYIVQLVNRMDTSMGSLILDKGYLGEISVGNGVYHAETRSLSQILRQQVGDLTSATCRCRRLGDAQCKVAVAGYRYDRTLSAISADGLTMTLVNDTFATGYYDYGVVTGKTGANAGQVRECKRHVYLGASQARIILRMPFPVVMAPGDVFTLEAGCDRTFAVCSAKFSNAVNFHGEPHVPGNTKIMQVGRPPQS